MAKTVKEVLWLADSQLGYKEVPVNRTKYGVWFGMDQTAWCAMFVCWLLDSAGFVKDVERPHTAWTPSLVQWGKAKGWIVPTPEPGDICVMQVRGPLRHNHVGIVRSVVNGKPYLVEGNTDAPGGRTGGMVMIKERKAGSQVLFGRKNVYIRPPYQAAVAAVPAPANPPVLQHVYPGILKKGMYNNANVRLVQQKLGISADGDFGPDTKRAVINFQRGRGLNADGVVGPVTWEALFG